MFFYFSQEIVDFILHSQRLHLNRLFNFREFSPIRNKFIHFLDVSFPVQQHNSQTFVRPGHNNLFVLTQGFEFLTC